ARRTARESTRPVHAAVDPAERYGELIEARRGFYREVSNFRARTDGRSPQQVVGDILGFLDTVCSEASAFAHARRRRKAQTMTTIPVNGPAPYEVVIDRGLDARIAAHAQATGADKVMVVHQPSIATPAAELAQQL